MSALPTANTTSFQYLGFRKYPTYRDVASPLDKSAATWLAGKRIDDDHSDVLWRVGDSLYDLKDFVKSHPGGSEWLELTRGTDITELFESSHFGKYASRVLAKYRVCGATGKRNSPYTFDENGFYCTLKRRVEPILAKTGRGPTRSMCFVQDSLAIAFLSFALLAAAYHSVYFSVAAGLFLAFLANCSHNFFHQKDNWRMYLFDFSFCTHREWRISHVLSHHVYPNTIMDYEISGFEPHFELLPNPNKKAARNLLSVVLFPFVTAVLFGVSTVARRIYCWRARSDMCRPHPSDFLFLAPLPVMCSVAPTCTVAIFHFLVIHASFGLFFASVGLTAAHHHPAIYHEGDAPRRNPDWGLCQLDAVRDKDEVVPNATPSADLWRLLKTSTSFGDHALHHLFPTVDQSKLPCLYPAFLKTCEEFGFKFEFYCRWKHVGGLFRQLLNRQPNSRAPDEIATRLSNGTNGKIHGH